MVLHLRRIDDRVVLAAATFVSSWVILVSTAPGIPIVWDEGEYLFRASRIIEWFRLGPDAFPGKPSKLSGCS